VFCPVKGKGLHRIWDFVSLTPFVPALGFHRGTQSMLVDFDSHLGVLLEVNESVLHCMYCSLWSGNNLE
jgi:hypothetical protein